MNELRIKTGEKTVLFDYLFITVLLAKAVTTTGAVEKKCF